MAYTDTCRIENGFEENEKVEDSLSSMSRILAHLLCILRTLIVWHVLEKDNGRETFPLEDATHSIASSVQGYTNSWSKVNALKRTFLTSLTSCW